MTSKIHTIVDFIEKVSSASDAAGAVPLLYRGHSKTSHKFEPSVFRNAGHRKNEHLMLRQLIAEHPGDFLNDRNTFDRLVRAQHYDLPTRLLDVTRNPLAALFFCCRRNQDCDGHVIILRPVEEKIKFFDGDTVAIVSNLALMSKKQKDALSVVTRDIHEKTDSLPDEKKAAKRVELFKENVTAQELSKLARLEKGSFTDRIDPIDIVKIHVVTPRKTHARIVAQNGAFLLFGLHADEKLLAPPMVKTNVVRIAANAKSDLIKQLSRINVDEPSLFPEIDKTAARLSSYYKR